MKLTTLYCDGTSIGGLSALKGMPVKRLHYDFDPKRDAVILRSIPTLETERNAAAHCETNTAKQSLLARLGPPRRSNEDDNVRDSDQIANYGARYSLAY